MPRSFIYTATNTMTISNLDIGEPLFITASGEYGPWWGRTMGPDGAAIFKWNQSMAPMHSFCKLVGNFGSSPPTTPSGYFGIGSAMGWAAGTAGNAGTVLETQMRLVIDDSAQIQDNHGALNITLHEGAQEVIDGIIAHLAGYGIRLYKDGTPDGIGGRAWSVGELLEVLKGVQVTMRAFHRTRVLLSPQDAWLDSPRQHHMRNLFRNVMGRVPDKDFAVLRVENGYVSPGCTGTVDTGCTSTGDNAILFYGYDVTRPITEHLVVHKLGHLFNDRTGGQLAGSGSLFDLMQNVTIVDRLGVRVMGIVDGDPNWRRGARGWGSGPQGGGENGMFTVFQQHPYQGNDTSTVTPESRTKRTKTIDEAAADMFLNWVYATVTDPFALEPGGTPSGAREGFLNMDWLTNGCQTSSGCPDDTNLGDARYSWMNMQMRALFNARAATWTVTP